MRFSFDFGDLRRGPPELELVPPTLEPPPAYASAIPPASRPRWLPPLLPVFHAREPLRVTVAGADAPAWAWRLRSSLAALFASAGARAGLSVREWHDGFAVGAGDLDQAASVPPAVVVAAECDPASLSCASRITSSYESERCFVAVHGAGGPALDRWIGPDTPRVLRFPAVGKPELAAFGRGVPPSLTCERFGRACLGLGQAIVARYRRLER